MPILPAMFSPFSTFFGSRETPLPKLERLIKKTLESDRPLDRKKLAESSGEEVDNLVIEYLNDPSSHIRASALNFLGYTKKEKYIPFIVEKFRDEHEDVREQAVLQIGEFKDKRVLGSLVEMLEDRYHNVRFAAFIGMLSLSSTKTEKENLVKVIEGLLGNSLWEKRRNVLQLFLKQYRDMGIA